MIGAIAGDIVGSSREGSPIKTTDFPLFEAQSRFTDDTVLTIAVAAAILDDRPYVETVREFGIRYPGAGYGGNFFLWLFQPDGQPYNSWGNGSAMRVSPVGFAFDTESALLEEAKKSAQITHNHPDGIAGAQAVAYAIFLARNGASKQAIKKAIEQGFSYDLNRTIEAIRPGYAFDVSCRGSVPEAIIAFLDSHDWESAVRNAVSLGGDSDTQACIAGGIAEAFYGPLPIGIAQKVENILPDDLWSILKTFLSRYL